jgi:membrane-associated phospholipid phosphatase
MREFFSDLPKNLLRVFSGKNLFWHFLAIALTYIFVSYGFDWKYFELTRGSGWQNFFWPAVILGFFGPVFGILIFFLVSVLKKKQKLIFTAYALAEAAILGLLVSDFFKFFTGRPGPPDVIGHGIVTNTSHIFRFGILKGGVFFGWPSSHTAVAVAMATCLWALYPKNKWVKIVSAVYALYIGIGVSMTIHWFSDFVAGAIIGSVIGVVVGKSIYGRYFSKYQ